MRQLFLLTSMNGTTIDEERSASICSIRTRQSFVNASLGNISNIEGKRRSCTDDIALWPLFQCDISKKQNNYDLLAHISYGKCFTWSRSTHSFKMSNPNVLRVADFSIQYCSHYALGLMLRQTVASIGRLLSH